MGRRLGRYCVGMGSPHFARISAQVSDVAARIPVGRVTSFAAVGAELDVPARYVAYIVSRWDEQQWEDFPWHRFLPEHGRPPRTSRGKLQQEILEREGVTFTAQGVADWTENFINVPLNELHHHDPSTPLNRHPE